MNLYDEIKSHFTLPDAYEDWAHYRNTLTDYLITQTDSVTLPLSFSHGMAQSDLLPTIAILGAGSCNDLDLGRLSSHFSKMTLIDYDEDAMFAALETYHLEDASNIECLPLSLNGFTDYDYRDFCEKLQFFLRTEQAELTSQRFEAYALSLLNDELAEKRHITIPLAPASYDYIWCFGVHSQLFSMFTYIYHAFEVNLRDTVYSGSNPASHAFYDRVKDENSRFIPLFHNTILAAAKKMVFLGLEQKSTTCEGAVEGAYQAICDIRNRSIPHEERIILWPFCPAKNLSYEMLILNIPSGT